MTISENAYRTLLRLRTPASPYDRPGDWNEGGISSYFGAHAVQELVNAGLAQRGGFPPPVPEKIAGNFAANMQRHTELLVRYVAEGNHLYPAHEGTVLVTERGWEYELLGA